MRQVGVGFTYGEIHVADLIFITNLMDDHKAQRVFRILERMFKYEVFLGRGDGVVRGATEM